MSDLKKSAFVTIIGRPSSGKSTLMNTMCGGKVAIVSPVPQTTRNRIRGIVNREKGQLVFMDTPGYHDSDRKLNLHLKNLAKNTLEDVDIVLYMIDASRAPGKEEALVLDLLRSVKDKVIVAVNKIDIAVSDPEGAKAFVRTVLPDAPMMSISAEKKTGVEELLDCILDHAKEGPEYYPDDIYTDQEPSFRITEVIREKAIQNTREEIPHAVYVEIADAEFDSTKEHLFVRAFLVAERESQKGMLIGKGACMIKKIRLEAEADLNEIFPYEVSLDLQVRVDKNWKSDDKLIKKLMF